MAQDQTLKLSANTLARIAGILYLLIICCGLFTEFFVRSSLILPGDAAATAANILANESLFRIGFASDLIMLLCDVAIAMVFYALLRTVSQTLALAAVVTRLAMDATLAINLLNHFYAILLLGGAEYLQVFDTAQLHALVSLVMQAQGVGYSIGLCFFALHCLVLGYLVYRSGHFPRAFGVLLALAGLSYFIDSFAAFLIPGYSTEDYAFIMLPALIAEVSFCGWLLFRGVRKARLEQAQKDSLTRTQTAS